VITTVRYGSRKQVVLNFNGRGSRREVPLSQLADYVTQQSNPGNVKDLAYAEIELPVEILRRGSSLLIAQDWGLRSQRIRRQPNGFYHRRMPLFW